MAWLNRTYDSVLGLTEWFFGQCFAALEPIERPVLCGLYNGRMYERFAAATATLSSAEDVACHGGGSIPTPDASVRSAACAERTTVPCLKRNAKLHYAGNTKPPENQPAADQLS